MIKVKWIKIGKGIKLILMLFVDQKMRLWETQIKLTEKSWRNINQLNNGEMIKYNSYENREWKASIKILNHNSTDMKKKKKKSHFLLFLLVNLLLLMMNMIKVVWCICCLVDVTAAVCDNSWVNIIWFMKKKENPK